MDHYHMFCRNDFSTSMYPEFFNDLLKQVGIAEEDWESTNEVTLKIELVPAPK